MAVSTRPLSGMGSSMITSKARDPVGGHHEQPALAGVVELTDLPRMDQGERVTGR